MDRNKKEFRPESFKVYMDAPCGRKIIHCVLKDLGKKEEYKNLLKYKPPFKETLDEIFESCC